MDFALTQNQHDIKALAAKLFEDLAKPEELPSFEAPCDWFNEKLWQELAKANLLGVVLPEDVGGLGMGIGELAVLLEEAGRACAPVPLWATLVLGALAIDRFGDYALRKRLLPPVVAGNSVLTAALCEPDTRNPGALLTRASHRDGSWTLDGTKAFVPAARLADRILLPARVDEKAIGMFLIAPDAPGVSLEAQATTTGENEYLISLAGARVEPGEVLGEPGQGEEILEWILERATAGLCALEVGVAERALRMTAEYTGKREQFGKPIATFQAVAQRAADAFIDLEALRLATAQAIWRLAEGLPARRELAIAKFWAAEGGHRVCYASQHLHGGIGVDTDYPLHHYYLRSRQIELTLGGAHTHLASLGRMLASDRTNR